MAVTRKFSLDEIEDLDLNEIGSAPWKFGRRATMIAKVDDKHWMFKLFVHHSEGWQGVDEGVTATQVHIVERTVKVWEPVE